MLERGAGRGARVRRAAETVFWGTARMWRREAVHAVSWLCAGAFGWAGACVRRCARYCARVCVRRLAGCGMGGWRLWLARHEDVETRRGQEGSGGTRRCAIDGTKDTPLTGGVDARAFCARSAWLGHSEASLAPALGGAGASATAAVAATATPSHGHGHSRSHAAPQTHVEGLGVLLRLPPAAAAMLADSALEL